VTGGVAIEVRIVHPRRPGADLEGERAGLQRAGGRNETARFFRAALRALDHVVIVESQFFEGVLAGLTFKIIKRHDELLIRIWKAGTFPSFVR
jgi:hypothetical protein